MATARINGTKAAARAMPILTPEDRPEGVGWGVGAPLAIGTPEDNGDEVDDVVRGF